MKSVQRGGKRVEAVITQPRAARRGPPAGRWTVSENVRRAALLQPERMPIPAVRATATAA